MLLARLVTWIVFYLPKNLNLYGIRGPSSSNDFQSDTSILLRIDCELYSWATSIAEFVDGSILVLEYVSKGVAFDVLYIVEFWDLILSYDGGNSPRDEDCEVG
jgi:hypothetical protein